MCIQFAYCSISGSEMGSATQDREAELVERQVPYSALRDVDRDLLFFASGSTFSKSMIAPITSARSMSIATPRDKVWHRAIR